MGYQAVFKRYELKYMVTAAQKEKILRAMEPHMIMDKYGRSTVRNIYFDTDDFVLARHSIAKPDFKEKLRIRSYSRADEESTVFVELKRKSDHIVYKRRVGLPEADAMTWLLATGTDPLAKTSQTQAATGTDPLARSSQKRSGRQTAASASPQVTDEIEYFRSTYKGLKPVLYLSYDREAYRMRPDAEMNEGGSEFRVTFDSNILCRETDLSLRSEAYGTPILKEGMFLMELKCPGSIPLWLTEVLSEEHIYKTSFSKYGTAYCYFMSEAPAERAHEISVESYAAARVRRLNESGERTASSSVHRRHGFRYRPSHSRATA